MKIEFNKEHDGYRYELLIQWDEAAFVNDKALAITVTGTRKQFKDKGLGERIEATVALSVDKELNIPVLEVSCGPASWRVPLDSMIPGWLKNDFSEEVMQQLTEWAAEQIPAYLFTGDPILGCLVRSGIAVGVGQIIACAKQTRETRGARKRLGEIWSCLGEHLERMGGRFIKLTFRCIIRLGF